MGPLLWIGFNAACKRNRVEGEFSFTTIPDAWSQLGFIDPDRVMSEIDLEAFFDYLGRVHETRRSHRGAFTVIEACRWDEHQTRRQQTNSEPGNPRSATRNTAKKSSRRRSDRPSEIEKEEEKEEKNEGTGLKPILSPSNVTQEKRRQIAALRKMA